jgi:hypothetical protein
MLHAIGHSDTHRISPGSAPLEGAYTGHSFGLFLVFIQVARVNGELDIRTLSIGPPIDALRLP